MKAKKLFPDLSLKRLWDKIKDLEDKVGEGSDINLDELNKNITIRYNQETDMLQCLVDGVWIDFKTAELKHMDLIEQLNGSGWTKYDNAGGGITVTVQKYPLELTTQSPHAFAYEGWIVSDTYYDLSRFKQVRLVGRHSGSQEGKIRLKRKSDGGIIADLLTVTNEQFDRTVDLNLSADDTYAIILYTKNYKETASLGLSKVSFSA